MKWLIVLGLILVLAGGVLVVVGGIPYMEEHAVETPIGDFGVETEETRRVPLAVSGTLLGLGVVLTVVGAVKLKGSR